MNSISSRPVRIILAQFGICSCFLLSCGCGGSESEPAAASSGGGGAAAAGVDVSGGDLAAAGPAGGNNSMSISPPELAGSGGGSDASSGAAGAPGGMPMGPPGGMPMGPPGGMGAGNAGAAAGMLGGGMPGGMLGGGMPGMPGMPGGAAPGVAPSTPPAPARPADVSKWTEKQLRDAVIVRDRRVLEAIEKRVKSKPGDAAVAETLMKLLAAAHEKPPVAPAQPAGSAPGYGMPGQPGVDGSGASSEPGAAGYGSAPGAPGYGNAPGAPGLSSPAGGPGIAPAMPGGPQGGAPRRPGGVGVPGTPQTSEPPSQSSTSPLPLDTMSLMVLEYATAWQGPAVGAMQGRLGAPGSGPGLLSAGAAAGQDPGTLSLQGGGAALNSGSGVAPGGATPGMLPGGLSGPGGMPGMGPGGMPGMGTGAPAASVATMTDRELVRAIAAGLLANNSAEAWQGLLEIVNGSAKSPLSLEETVEVVVLALCSHQQTDPEQSRQVLMAMISSPERFPTSTQNASLRALASVASQVLAKQTGLPGGGAVPEGIGAGQLAGGGMPGMPGGAGMMPGGASLSGGLPGAPGMPAMPGVPGAGGGLPGAPGLPAMSGGAAGVPGAAPGLSGGEPSGELGGLGFAGAGGSAPATATAAPMERLPDAVLALSADFFYTPAFAQLIVAQLDQVADLSTSESLLRLAGNLPLQPVREALFRAFEKHHAGGADALNTAGVFPDGMSDPGVLVILKSLPRQRPARGDEGESAPLDSWTVASQQLVLSYTAKLAGMSQGVSKLTANPKSFPIRAHRGAEFEYTGVLKLTPAANAAPGTGISETRMYYARTSFVASKERERKDALDHYRGLGAAIQRADAARGAMWMDGVKAGSTGMRRSVDVMIRSGGAGGGFGAAAGSGSAGGIGAAPGVPGLPGGGGAGQSYTIEVVMVEIADPRGGSGGQDATANAN
ncbi:MAG: hypothetical protein ACKO2P_13280 [Planctomycetota bacterium]